MNNTDNLLKNINNYRKKHFYSFIIKGVSISLLLLLSIFIIFNYLEYILYFNKTGRTILFFSFIGILLYSISHYVIKPYLFFKKNSTDRDIAEQIGKENPSIKDKLLNTIILLQLDNNVLAEASIHQRTQNYKLVEFDKSIDMRNSFKYLTYLGFILLFLMGIFIYKPLIISGSTERIINFNKEYKKSAGFNFKIKNKTLEVLDNEDFMLQIEVFGKILPENVYLQQNNSKNKLTKENLIYFYEFKNIQKDIKFKIVANGYESEEYILKHISRPIVENIDITINYPKYLKKENDLFSNINNINIPEGSTINFSIDSKFTDFINILSNIDTITATKNNNAFNFSKIFKISSEIEFKLFNKKTENKNPIKYNVNIIKDLRPTITLETYLDTTLFKYITLAGEIEDDYGIKKLNLNYKSKNSTKYNVIAIPITNSNKQTYFYTFNIDSILNNEGIEYYLEVWDNDEINGSKSTKTSKKELLGIKKEEIQEKIDNDKKGMQNSFEKSVEDSKKMKDNLEKMNEKIKSKKDLNWQDKNDLEQLLEQQNNLQKEINELSKEFQKLKQQQDKFDKPTESLSKKEEELQNLLEQLIDDETKKMFEEMEKLLEKKDLQPEKISSLLEEMQKKDFNLEKELERAKELFKKLKMEEKIQDTIEKLDDLSKKQNEEAIKNEEKPKSEEEKTKNQVNQEKLNKEFEKIKEDLKEIEKLNEESKSKLDNELEKQEEKANEVEKQQQQASENLQKNNSSKSSENQKNASDKMKEMSESLMQMQSKMEEEQNEEDLKNLRKILNNLLKLTYTQEDLMNDFRTIKTVNPQFVEKSANQLKIKEDAIVIEDSLLALASRNFQIQKIVINELFSMNEYIDKSVNAIKDRDLSKITSNQQFAMTSINNLALLLSEVMEQMQMEQGKQSKGEQMCNKPKGNKPKPSMALGKKQGEISKEIKELKKSGKTGKEQSERLAKLASQQEQLRKALQELGKMQDKGKNGEKGDIGKLEKLMEENEIDLINKRLTEQTILRQEEIMTRLLQAEKAVRERDLDEKRESKSAEEIKREYPPNFEKYLKEKEKEIELLKTYNPKYTPYYKNKVSDYLNKL